MRPKPLQSGWPASEAGWRPTASRLTSNRRHPGGNFVVTQAYRIVESLNTLAVDAHFEHWHKPPSPTLTGASLNTDKLRIDSLMSFSLDRTRIDRTSREEVLKELERVAAEHGYKSFGYREFNTSCSSTINANTVKRAFDGKWSLAITALRERLSERGIKLTARDRNQHSDDELFAEMERIWLLVGQRPSRDEWNSSDPKISYNTARSRFGGWVNACVAFIECKMGHSFDEVPTHPVVGAPEKKKTVRSRSIPLKTRLTVLQRDNFCCVLCGRSPVTHFGVSLHIDHIQPFSKGGDHSADNLRVLCSDCNLGKSDSENV